MIDLDATGPVYRGHKLARIVSEYDTGFIEGFTYGGNDPVHWSRKPVSTKAWARLDVRVIGNIWGLPVTFAGPVLPGH